MRKTLKVQKKILFPWPKEDNIYGSSNVLREREFVFKPFFFFFLINNLQKISLIFVRVFH